MPRRQIQGSNIAVFAGPSPSTGQHTTANIKELQGVTSFSYEISDSKEEAPVFGQRYASRISSTPPTVTADFSYYVGNLDNEKSLGFVTSGVSGAFSQILNATQDERNYFVMIAGDGNDAVGSVPGSTPCLGFGNGTISNWSLNASVGSFPTVTVSIDAIDMAYYADSDNEPLPAINTVLGTVATGVFTLPTAVGKAFSGRDTVLLPRDINVNLSGLTGIFYDTASACVQSFDVSVDFGRDSQICLGGFYRKESVMADSIPVTFNVEFLAKDMITGRLSNFLCGTGTYTAIASMRRPSCLGTGSLAATYTLRGLTFESLSYNVDAGGDASTVTMGFTTSLGGANDLVNGLFITGIANT